MQARSRLWQPITTAQQGDTVLLFHLLGDLMQVGLFDENTRA
jgi:hypothetical protein